MRLLYVEPQARKGSGFEVTGNIENYGRATAGVESGGFEELFEPALAVHDAATSG
jgi:hypothetical protein